MTDSPSSFMDADQKAREQALDAQASVIVQAPAGSGKTSLLVQRMLLLLAQVENPHSVLAVTFTRKAASEMRCRLLKELAAAASNSETPSSQHEQLTRQLAAKALKNDEKHGWQLLKAPWQLRVQTLDAYWRDIVRQAPLTAGVSGEENLLSQPGQAYQHAAQSLLAQADESSHLANALKSLVSRCRNRHSECEGLLAALLEKREQWLPLFVKPGDGRKDTEQFFPQLEQTLKEVVSAHLKELHQQLHSSLEVMGMTNDFIPLLNHAGQHAAEEKQWGALAQLTQIPEPVSAELASWRAIGELLTIRQQKSEKAKFRQRVDKTLGFFPQDEYTKAKMEALLLSLAEHDSQGGNTTSLAKLLVEVKSLCNDHFQKWEREALGNLWQVMEAAPEALQAAFEALGGIDYTEMLLAARRCLQQGKHVEQLRLQHLLVDEFQDTSVAQFQSLCSLVGGWQLRDGKTVFLVGDPTQSIYRFRKAEAGLFMQAMKYGLGAVQLKPLALRCNFRSVPDLVTWSNGVFSKIFPQCSNLLEGAAAHLPSQAVRTKVVEAAAAWQLASNSKQEADAIACWLKQNLQQQPQARAAVLYRAGTHVRDLLSALKQHQLRFHHMRRIPLASRQEVLDLLALLRALLLRDDNLAWMSVLRAPWCGFSLKSLTLLAETLSADGLPAKTIWAGLHTEHLQKQLSEYERTAFVRLRSAFEWGWQWQGQLPLCDWLQQTWLRLQAPACLPEKGGLEHVHAFFELLEHISLDSWFFPRLQEALDDAPGAQATVIAKGEIAVMSIHQAKGLEFELVVLPALQRQGRLDRSSLMSWEEYPLASGNSRLLFAPRPTAGEPAEHCLYQFIHKISQRKNHLELARLLYVGCSRARERLLLSAVYSPSAREDEPSKTGSLLRLLWDAKAVPQSLVSPLSTRESAYNTADLAQNDQGWQWRLPKAWQPPSTPPDVHPQGPALSEQQLSGATVPGAEDETTTDSTQIFRQPHFMALRCAGIETHRWLETFARYQPEQWHHVLQQAQRRVRANLCQLGTPLDALDKTASHVMLALSNTLEDDKGRWLLQQHSLNASELRLDSFLAEQADSLLLRQSILDRTFLDEAGVRWIVDFKTAAPFGDSANFILRQRQTYQSQLERYAQLFYRIEPKRPLKLGLYFPLLKHLESWDAPPGLKKSGYSQ